MTTIRATTIAAIVLTGAFAAAAAPPAKPAPGNPAPGAAAPAARTPPPAGEAAATNASRYRLNDVEAYIKEHLTGFEISRRAADPFGLLQDPAAAPPPPKLASKVTNKFLNIPPTPFVDVVNALRVTAVMPNHQRFLIQSRSISRGQHFPINYRDKSVTVEVLHVGTRKIDFKNVTTGETASLTLDILPPGMSRGAGGGTGPPGLQRDDPSAPIEVNLPLPQPVTAQVPTAPR
jgi:hypothetical protein